MPTAEFSTNAIVRQYGAFDDIYTLLGSTKILALFMQCRNNQQFAFEENARGQTALSFARALYPNASNNITSYPRAFISPIESKTWTYRRWGDSERGTAGPGGVRRGQARETALWNFMVRQLNQKNESPTVEEMFVQVFCQENTRKTNISSTAPIFICFANYMR